MPEARAVVSGKVVGHFQDTISRQSPAARLQRWSRSFDAGGPVRLAYSTLSAQDSGQRQGIVDGGSSVKPADRQGTQQIKFRAEEPGSVERLLNDV